MVTRRFPFIMKKFSRAPASSTTALTPHKQPRPKPKQAAPTVPKVPTTAKCFEGKYNLSNMKIQSYKDFNVAKNVTHLILSKNPLVDFVGFPPCSQLIHLDMSGTEIHSFKGFPTFPHMEEIILSNTPVSNHPQYRIAILLITGSTLKTIDQSIINHPERQVANLYPPECQLLVKSGWMPTLPPPTPEEIDRISEKIVVERKKSIQVARASTPRKASQPVVVKSQKQILEHKIRQQEDEIAKLEELLANES